MEPSSAALERTRLDRWRAACDDHARDATYVGIAVVIILLLAAVVLPLTVDADEPFVSEQSRELAAQLVDRLDYAGIAAPRVLTAARVYGENGGRTCSLPVIDLVDELRAEHVGSTPTAGARGNRVGQRQVRHVRVVLQTYCPERTGDFDRRVHAVQGARALRPLPS